MVISHRQELKPNKHSGSLTAPNNLSVARLAKRSVVLVAGVLVLASICSALMTHSRATLPESLISLTISKIVPLGTTDSSNLCRGWVDHMDIWLPKKRNLLQMWVSGRVVSFGGRDFCFTLRCWSKLPHASYLWLTGFLCTYGRDPTRMAGALKHLKAFDVFQKPLKVCKRKASKNLWMPFKGLWKHLKTFECPRPHTQSRALQMHTGPRNSWEPKGLLERISSQGHRTRKAPQEVQSRIYHCP